MFHIPFLETPSGHWKVIFSAYENFNYCQGQSHKNKETLFLCNHMKIKKLYFFVKVKSTEHCSFHVWRFFKLWVGAFKEDPKWFIIKINKVNKAPVTRHTAKHVKAYVGSILSRVVSVY